MAVERDSPTLGDRLAPLDSILCTEQLNRRPRRVPDYEPENRALLDLTQALCESPLTVLQSLADTLLNALGADSAGVSLLTNDGKRFSWQAISGCWRPHVGGGTPRDFSPCGDVFDRNAPLLFTHWERRYPYLLAVTPFAQEALLAPFYVDGKAVGAIWIITHDDRRTFDFEDLRRLKTFARFAEAAYEIQKQTPGRPKADSLAHLHQLSLRLTATSDLRSSLNEALEGIMELQGADFGIVRLYEELTGELRIVAHRNLDQESLEYFHTVPATHLSDCSSALATRERIIIEDVTTDPSYAPHRAIAASMGYRAVQSTPLVDRTRQIIGLLSTAFREPYHPTASELRLADFYAKQAADVIASRLSEQRLRESEERLKVAVDLVGLGGYAWNPETNALHWDARMKAMWGLDSNAPVDYNLWHDHIHPDDQSHVDAAVRWCTDPLSGGIYDLVYRVIPKSGGRERWIATRGRMEFDEKDRPVWFNGVAIDITDRKRLEFALEGLVEERTLQLKTLNEQLRVQVEQRESAEAELQQLRRVGAIGQITSGIAHDFNNLLSVILTNVNLLSRAATNPDDQEGVDLIRNAAERAVTLTRQLLAFSRKQPLKPELIALNDKISEMQKMLGVTLGGAITLNMRLAPDLWHVLTDPAHFELVILNLAINARDAMHAGGALTVETHNTEITGKPMRPEDPSPGSYVVLDVSDTGDGIPDDVLPHVFEPFFTTKQSGNGSGLGLAQAFGFAKRSGGGVAVSTRLGKGTSVKVFFPRANMTEMPFTHESTRASKPEQQRGRQLNILIVDDDQAVLKSTLRLLHALGHEALPAQSGRAAIGILEDNRDIDLVLADIAMPEMTGLHLAKAIRTMRAEVPVILVTGCRDSKFVEEPSAFPILQKPFNETDLKALIAQVFNKPEAP